MKEIKNVKLFVNQKEKAKETAILIQKSLEENGFFITEEDFDLGLAIGGDGTFLRMIKDSKFRPDVLYVGVNVGTLGFAQDINVEEIDDFIKGLTKEEIHYEEIGIGEAKIKIKEKRISLPILNEIVIREKELNTLGIKVEIDGVELENYVGDGLLIATSFGSTAYNLSFGGSIVDNSFHTLQITPVAPLNNKSYRNLLNSVILPSNKKITLTPKNLTNNLLLTIDGDNYTYNEVDNIELSIQEKTIKIIRKKDYNFTHKINDKFLK